MSSNTLGNCWAANPADIILNTMPSIRPDAHTVFFNWHNPQLRAEPVNVADLSPQALIILRQAMTCEGCDGRLPDTSMTCTTCYRARFCTKACLTQHPDYVPDQEGCVICNLEPRDPQAALCCTAILGEADRGLNNLAAVLLTTWWTNFHGALEWLITTHFRQLHPAAQNNYVGAAFRLDLAAVMDEGGEGRHCIRSTTAP